MFLALVVQARLLNFYIFLIFRFIFNTSGSDHDGNLTFGGRERVVFECELDVVEDAVDAVDALRLERVRAPLHLRRHLVQARVQPSVARLPLDPGKKEENNPIWIVSWTSPLPNVQVDPSGL